MQYFVYIAYTEDSTMYSLPKGTKQLSSAFAEH